VAIPPISCIQGPDFVMVCSDTTASHSIITIKQDEDKLVPIDSSKLFGISGEAGDRVNFTEFIIANTKLYELRNNTKLSTHAVAHLTRGELAKALRKVHREDLFASAVTGSMHNKTANLLLLWTRMQLHEEGNGFGHRKAHTYVAHLCTLYL